MRAGLLIAAVLLTGCLAAPAADLEPSSALDPSAPTSFATALAELKLGAASAAATGGEMQVFVTRPDDFQGRGAYGAPQPLNVTLREAQFLTLDAFASIDNDTVPLPKMVFYEGEAVEHPGSMVRLAVAEDWVRGVVRVEDRNWLVRVGLNGNLPWSYVPVPRTATGASGAPDELAEGDPIEGPGFEEQGCLSAAPPYLTPMPETGRATNDVIITELVLDADAQFLAALGDQAFPVMLAQVWEVDSIYEHEVAIRFQVVGLHANTDPDYFPDPVEEAPLEKLAEYWDPRTDVDRDIVHLFTGQRSNYAQANCIGGAGMPEYGYAFTPLNWDAEMNVFHQTALAHEWGHLFAAHHHYGNHVETMIANDPTAVTLPTVNPGFPPSVRGTPQPQPGWATLMIQGYTAGSKPMFGTLEKSVIRGWAEARVTES